MTPWPAGINSLKLDEYYKQQYTRCNKGNSNYILGMEISEPLWTPAPVFYFPYCSFSSSFSYKDLRLFLTQYSPRFVYIIVACDPCYGASDVYSG